MNKVKVKPISHRERIRNSAINAMIIRYAGSPNAFQNSLKFLEGCDMNDLPGLKEELIDLAKSLFKKPQ